ncbi:MAG: hypothetical protein WCX71_05625, partial [Candidatus Buchananbacteria bacterium]
FCGVFKRAQANVALDRVFSLEEIKLGVAEFAPERAPWFNDEARKAILALVWDWKQALDDVKGAEEAKKTFFWKSNEGLPGLLGRTVRVLELRSDAFSAAKASRYRHYDLVVVHRSNGHCQVFCGTMFQLKSATDKTVIGKWRVDLDQVARRLRLLESRFTVPRKFLECEGNDVSWTQSGFCYYQNLEKASAMPACPWYLPEFRTAVFNGSLSSPNVPPTKIRHDKIMVELLAGLPECSLLRQNDDDGKWAHANVLSNGNYVYVAKVA